MDFTDYFELHIYDRGRDIFKFSNAVILETVTDKTISATVQGTYLYHVAIEVDNDEVFFDCTCPYAESGNLCKHMVATLLTAQNSDTESITIQFLFQSACRHIYPGECVPGTIRKFPVRFRNFAQSKIPFAFLAATSNSNIPSTAPEVSINTSFICPLLPSINS
jgi:hypothetical protein